MKSDTTPQPNYYRQCRERLEKAKVDSETICDILDLLDLQYRLGLNNGSNIIKEVYKLEG